MNNSNRLFYMKMNHLSKLKTILLIYHNSILYLIEQLEIVGVDLAEGLHADIKLGAVLINCCQSLETIRSEVLNKSIMPLPDKYSFLTKEGLAITTLIQDRFFQ